MNVVTIPKKLAQKGDLVVIPKEEYEAFSTWKETVRVHVDEQWFWTPEWQEREAEADEAIRAGKTFGPFNTSKELLSLLKRKKKS